MRWDCNFFFVLILTLPLLGGCVSMRCDDPNWPAHSHPTLAAAPQPSPLVPLEDHPDLEPPPVETAESVVIPLVPEVTSIEPLPAPTEEICQAPVAEMLPPELLPLEAEACVAKPSLLCNLRGCLHGLFHWPRREPIAPPQIPPRPKFHPVPTRPVFAQPVVYDEDAPGTLPSRGGKPMPIPPPADIQPGTVNDTDAPAPLPEEVRIARPLSLNAPIRTEPNAEASGKPSADYHLSIEVGP